MNKVTRKKSKDFTIISNVFLRDKNLSLKAKGFLAVVMGLPEDWEFTINGICGVLKEGKTAVYSTINELKELGYCNVEICRNEKGMIEGNDYSFYEKPCKEVPHTENPNSANKTQLSTNINKNELEEEKNKEDKSSKKKHDEEFVERMYKLYPTHCPKRNHSLGKSQKDKLKIARLLKTYTMEQIEAVIQNEVDTKYGNEWMQNFSTFLNNFPDPNCIEKSNPAKEEEDKVSNNNKWQTV